MRRCDVAGNAKWSVLTYIAAHNNLELLGRVSRQQILDVGSTTGVVHGMLYDGSGGAARYVVGKPGAVRTQDRLGDFDSGDPDALIETAKWFYGENPADRYGLVLWSHGTGWEPEELEEVAKEARPGAPADPAESRVRAAAPGSQVLFRTTLRSILKPDRPTERAILFDDGTGHSLDTLELARVADAIAGLVGQPLELLGMDACLMANLEVAYQLRNTVRYLVASEELVPGHSWPYPEIYGALRANPDLGSGDFARLVVDEYVSYYTANPPAGGDVTKVALDLGQIDGLVQATDGLADVLRRDMGQVGNLLWQVQRGAREHETRGGKRQPSKFDYYLWDIGSFAAGVVGSDGSSGQVKQLAEHVLQQLEPGVGSVLAEGHGGAWFDGIGGVTTYFMPPRRQAISPSYAKLAFASDTHWDEMLTAYHENFS